MSCFTPAGSDASWLARPIGERLTELSGGAGRRRDPEPPEDDLRDGFRGGDRPCGRDRRSPCPLPACLGLIEAGPGERGESAFGAASWATWSPSCRRRAGVVRWSDERAKPFEEEKTLAALGAREHEPGTMPRPCGARSGRTAPAPQPAGRLLGGQSAPAWAGRELTFEASVEPGAAIVLCDGRVHAARRRVRRAYSDGTLHGALAAGRGAELMQELRERRAEAILWRRLSSC